MNPARVLWFPATSTRLTRTRCPLATETRSTTSPGAAPDSSRTATAASGNPCAANAAVTRLPNSSPRRSKNGCPR